MDRLGKRPCAIIYESGSDISSVVEAAKNLSKADDVIIAVKEDGKLAKKLLPAYINAYIRNQEKSMHSSSLSLEAMLFLAGNMNITGAINSVGADKPRFMLFSSRRELAEMLAKKCRLKKIKETKLTLDWDIASNVAMVAIKDYK